MKLSLLTTTISFKDDHDESTWQVRFSGPKRGDIRAAVYKNSIYITTYLPQGGNAGKTMAAMLIKRTYDSLELNKKTFKPKS